MSGTPEPAAPARGHARPERVHVWTDLGLLTMVAVWAVNFSVIKVGLEEVPPLAFNALRFPLAALVVYGLLRWQGPIPVPRGGDAWKIVGLGILGNVLYQACFIFGIDRTLAGNAALLLAATPLLTALLSSALGHESVGARAWLGVAATVAGIGLVIIGGGGGLRLGAGTVIGDLLMLGAAVTWAGYTVGARGLIIRHGSVAVTAWTLWAGSAVLVLMGLPELARLDLASVSPGAWGSVAFAGALGIGLAYTMWYRGVGRIGNTRTAAYSNLVPVLALVVAWLWLGETPTVPQLVGAAVIIGGVTLVCGPGPAPGALGAPAEPLPGEGTRPGQTHG